ncbi:phosphoethanolamine transferase [Vibrio neonatus]|uniref:phosphoethanolamine transferase n=1 Tax=Vibrio neonatus TaxID=278860 RepID=UPI0021C36954|nr:phosphoethanolamine--lipid A transferase [Vibrio neonatus]
MKVYKMKVSINQLPFILAVYYTVIINLPIAREIIHIIDGLESVKIGFIITIPFFFLAAFNFIFELFSWPKMAKPFFVFLLLTSSLVSYGMFNYGIYVDYGMIENLFETNTSEASSYLSLYSVLWVVFMGGLPAILLSLTKLEKISWKRFLARKTVSITCSLLVVTVIAALYYKDYASIGRNNKHLQKMIIPTEYARATVKYINNTYFKKPMVYRELGLDAKLSKGDSSTTKPTLLVFVLGETARVQNYQYYGYERETNAYTKPFDPVFFSHVESCGTATAVSVPCMFSNMNRGNYDKERAYHQDNAIDIMKRAGIHSVWIEHDGGDKGVAHQIKKKTIAPDDEDHHCSNNNCYDTDLLDSFEDDTKGLQQDSILFYHISGSHGPTYYKRYPSSHRRFAPDCPRSDIENCTNEEVVNSYDNTILYTDFFIAQTIEKLQKLEDEYNVALIYISDHGESLGENGIYLHGMPYSLAPPEQTHVPMMFWASDALLKNKHLDTECLRKIGKEQSFSHDNLFDSLLGFMDVATSEYRKKQDIFALCRS